jgi:hypothetical protein
MTVVQILKGAVALIQKGWTHEGDYFALSRIGNMQYCALGAIGEFVYGDPRDAERTPEGSLAVEALRDVMPEFALGPGRVSITRWNDAQSSKAPVIAKFREAIALAEEQGV